MRKAHAKWESVVYTVPNAAERVQKPLAYARGSETQAATARRLAFDSVAVRLQELETPRRQIPGRDFLRRSGVHRKVTGVPDFVQPSKDRVEVDSTRLPERQIPRARRSAWGSRS